MSTSTYIITSNSADLGIRRQAAIDDVFSDRVELFSLSNTSPNQIHDLLVRKAVPNTITCEHQKLFFARVIVRDHLRVRRHNLLFGGE